jgi:hypothetical protein
MGVYRYTLRATTKRVGGREIGQFKFAFKEGWGTHRDPVCRRLIKAGERAADKLRKNGVKLFVQGSWGDHQPVYYIDAAFSDFTEELCTCPHVGDLRQDSLRRWWLHKFSEEEMLRRFPEIGVLNSEEGKRFYHSMRPGHPFTSEKLERVATDVLIMRLVQRAAA